MEKKRIILASGSPRRKELLLQIGIVPEIIVSHVEEKITSAEPSGVVMSLAEQKAVDVAEDMPEGAVVLGSDTVVAADGKILGKPKSHEEAYEMIKRLAGRSHQVYTGVWIKGILRECDGTSGAFGVPEIERTWRCVEVETEIWENGTDGDGRLA